MAIIDKSDLFKGKSGAVINAMLRESYLADGKRRMDRTEKRLRMLWDDYECDVRAKVQSLVDPETYISQETRKGLIDFIDITNNVYKAIIIQLAMLYKKSPLREFDEKSREIFDHVYGVSEVAGIKSSLFDDKFKKANMYVQAVNDVYLYFVPRGEQIDIDVLTPNNLHIIPKHDNPMEPDVIMIKRNPEISECGEHSIYKPNQEYYVVWTDTEHYRLVKDGQLWREIAIDGNPDMINPYGVLPFVGIHKVDNDVLWNETLGEDLYQIGLWTAAFTTIWNQCWTWHNFKQLSISTDEKQKIPQGMGRAPDKAIVVPFESKVQALDWTVDTSDLFDQIQKKAATTAAKHGVDLEFIKAGAQSQGDSGIKLRIKQSMLKEMREDQIKTFTKAEMESFEIIKKILSYQQDKEIEGDMNIKYHDMEVYQDQKETLEILEKEIAADLVSKVDAFLQKFPHYTRGEAMEKLKQNIEENNELRGMKDVSLLDEIEK